VENSSRRILTFDEGAAKLRVSPRTLKRICEAGKVRKIQLAPRRVGVFEDELLAYAERQAEQEIA
jgi:hypothetical protein